MPILSKGYTFTAEQVTSAKLNALVDSATFASGAVDAATMILDGGVLKVGTIQTGNIATNAITAVKITDSNVTTAKIAAGAVTTEKIADLAVTTAKITDSNVTTAKIADANITPAKLSGAQSGSAPIYGVRAWVSFNAAGTIQASGNVSSVTKVATGKFKITLTTALADTNYAAVATSSGTSSVGVMCSEYDTRTTTDFYLLISTDSGATDDPSGKTSVIFMR